MRCQVNICQRLHLELDQNFIEIHQVGSVGSHQLRHFIFKSYGISTRFELEVSEIAGIPPGLTDFGRIDREQVLIGEQYVKFEMGIGRHILKDPSHSIIDLAVQTERFAHRIFVAEVF